MGRNRRALAGAVLALGLGLTGCSGTDDAGTEEPLPGQRTDLPDPQAPGDPTDSGLDDSVEEGLEDDVPSTPTGGG